MQNLTYFIVGCNLYCKEDNVQLIEQRSLIHYSSFIFVTSGNHLLMTKNRSNGSVMVFDKVSDVLDFCRGIYPGIQKHTGAVLIEDSILVNSIIEDLSKSSFELIPAR